MKILFALMVFFLPMSSLTTTPETTIVENKTDIVNVEVEFTDGSLKTFVLSVDDLSSIHKLELLENVNTCTYTLPDGSCNCKAAWTCFLEHCL